MNSRVVRLICSVTAGGGLLYLYLIYLSLYLSNPRLYPQTTPEIFVTGLQVTKLLAIVSIRRLRFAKTEVIWIIFSLETLLIPFLTGAYIFTGDRAYLQTFLDIFSVWPVVLLLVTPPYFIFRYSAEMYRKPSLTRSLPSAVLELAFLSFMVNVFLTAAGSARNIEGVLLLITSGLRAAVVAGRNPSLLGAEFAVPTISMYIALIVYSALPGDDGAELKIQTFLLLPLLSTIVLLGWILLAVAYIPNAIVALTIPTMAITFFIWLMGRVK